MVEHQRNEEQAAVGKKRLPIKTILILLVVLGLEAATVMVVFMITGKPSPVQADKGEADDRGRQEEPVEALLVEGKFPNVRRGNTMLYDTRIFVMVKRKHEQKVLEKIESMKARITTDIKTIISQAEPSNFAEPSHATLTRQIKAALDERLGCDPSDNKPLVTEVLVNEMTGFDANNF